MIVAQHTKTITGDHGLERDGDAIVVWLRLPSKLHRAAAGEQAGSSQNAWLHCLIGLG
jgi:hypothetical protein